MFGVPRLEEKGFILNTASWMSMVLALRISHALKSARANTGLSLSWSAFEEFFGPNTMVMGSTTSQNPDAGSGNWVPGQMIPCHYDGEACCV